MPMMLCFFNKDPKENLFKLLGKIDDFGYLVGICINKNKSKFLLKI